MKSRRVIISIYDDEENPYYAGGGPAVVRRVASALAQDYDVVVLTAGRRLARREAGAVTYVYLPVLLAGARGSQLLWALVLPFVALFASYALWLESFTPPFSSNLVPLFTRRPVIGVAQSLSGRVMAARYRVNFPLRLERLLLRRYRDVVVLNEYDAEVVRRCSPRTDVHVITNWVEMPTTAVTDAKDGEYAVFLGRIDIRLKGLDLLLDAYRKHPEDLLPLVIAGAGPKPQEQSLARLIETCGAPVRWVGKVDDLGRTGLLDRAALVVVPSREESFSLAALEALSHGRPVVHFDLPQLSWMPPGAHLSVPSFDVGALAGAIADYSRDPVRRSAAGHCAHDFAENFNQRNRSRYLSLVRARLS
ncbi:glycosyltransferase family 4 protein [Kineosporia rhizophila]|uniref:glycosyltransferase family 4 protein n=1 Tax=Kineosporia rhizophila TaxID=84633 RepID=UPI001E4FC718|nr:glycosyltransferase family 4 protein [Kineosporia rhizophila]MCE0538780.1 glycosyltransferase family 4 protein [Kineosporia rhizophila]